MAITDEFVCPNVRFLFFNGKKRYTVHYATALRTWYVFDEDTEEDCLAKFELPNKKRAMCNQHEASHYLEKYFASINSEYFASAF